MDDNDTLTLNDLIAWGRNYEELLKKGSHGGFHVPRPVLDHFIAAANTALEQQRERESKKPRSQGGRPPGGMGEQKMRLIANGVREEDADRIVARAFGKPPAAVRRAYENARKKPPR